MPTEFSVSLAPEFLALKCRALRDLAWSLLCSSLFAPSSNLPYQWLNHDRVDETVVQNLLIWLKTIDADPLLLDTHLAEQRSTRLGIYFEQLLSFYFAYYEINGERQFDLLAKNHQVNVNKRTVGEFDFIIFERSTGHIKHVEVAVKFYLGYKNYNSSSLQPIKKNAPLYNWHNWVGPNFRDTLAIKMRHLQEHQLQLGKTAAGAKVLAELMNKEGYGHHSTKDTMCQLHISGRFFIPKAYAIKSPKYSSRNLTNFWLKNTNTLQILDESKHTRYCLLPKQYWLSELVLKDIEDGDLQVFTKDTMLQFLASQTTDKFANEWHFATLDMNKVIDQKKIDARVLRIELGRFFIIN